MDAFNCKLGTASNAWTLSILASSRPKRPMALIGFLVWQRQTCKLSYAAHLTWFAEVNLIKLALRESGICFVDDSLQPAFSWFWPLYQGRKWWSWLFVCMYGFMYVCMYVCMYACMYVCMYLCMYALYIHVCIYVCIIVSTCMVLYWWMNGCIYWCVYRRIFVHVFCMYACMHSWMYVFWLCIYVCMYVCMYVHVYMFVCLNACMYISIYLCMCVYGLYAWLYNMHVICMIVPRMHVHVCVCDCVNQLIVYFTGHFSCIAYTEYKLLVDYIRRACLTSAWHVVVCLSGQVAVS